VLKNCCEAKQHCGRYWFAVLQQPRNRLFIRLRLRLRKAGGDSVVKQREVSG
jgi:hypothetical protein